MFCVSMSFSSFKIILHKFYINLAIDSGSDLEKGILKGWVNTDIGIIGGLGHGGIGGGHGGGGLGGGHGGGGLGSGHGGSGGLENDLTKNLIAIWMMLIDRDGFAHIASHVLGFGGGNANAQASASANAGAGGGYGGFGGGHGPGVEYVLLKTTYKYILENLNSIISNLTFLCLEKTWTRLKNILISNLTIVKFWIWDSANIAIKIITMNR